MGPRRRWSQPRNLDAECPRGGNQPIIITRKLHQFAASADEIHCGEMNRIQCSNADRKRLQRPTQREPGEFNHFDLTQYCLDLVLVGLTKSARPNAVPDLVFEQSA